MIEDHRQQSHLSLGDTHTSHCQHLDTHRKSHHPHSSPFPQIPKCHILVTQIEEEMPSSSLGIPHTSIGLTSWNLFPRPSPGPCLLLTSAFYKSPAYLPAACGSQALLAPSSVSMCYPWPVSPQCTCSNYRTPASFCSSSSEPLRSRMCACVSLRGLRLWAEYMDL